MKNALMPPEFIIIGAMRAGTTALADRLSRHPEIAMSRLKETDYFIAEKNFSRGPLWYQSLFPKDKPIRGEASPNYAKGDVFARVPQRIHAARPDAKLIYIVRDPVERFWSHYNHTYLMGGRVPSPDLLLEHHEGRHILASSMYYRQLSAFLDVFPAHQICIVDLADLTGNTGDAFSNILGFLGANRAYSELPLKTMNSADALATTPGWALKFSQHKALTGLRSAAPAALKGRIRSVLKRLQRTSRNTPLVSESSRRRVAEALAEDIAQFRRLVGRSFAHWSI